MRLMHDDEHPSGMVFCKDKYDSEVEMWNDITAFLKMLMMNDYIAVFRCDDTGLGIYGIDYCYADPEFGGDRPFWLSDEEVELLEAEAEKGEEDDTD